MHLPRVLLLQNGTILVIIMQLKTEVGDAVSLEPEDVDFYLQCASFREYDLPSLSFYFLIS